MINKNNTRKWYALQATYGREKKAYDFISSKGTIAFYPTVTSEYVNADGTKTTKESSLIPNIFFVFATDDEVKSYVYDNVNLPFLRFYYNRHHDGTKEPMIIPDHQMESLRIFCKSKESGKKIVMGGVPKFKSGQLVRVVEGPFMGIVGVVKRWNGQQRVGIDVEGLGTFISSYIPNHLLESIA